VDGERRLSEIACAGTFLSTSHKAYGEDEDE
jgi:hypothetical protein